MVLWVETECWRLQEEGDLAVDLPPCLFPYQRHGDWDYRPRIERLNPPGCYANGGVWPFICGFYVAALVAAGRMDLAEKKLIALTELVRGGKNPALGFGFNEWHQAQDGLPKGNDWQTWSAALYIYAAECVRQGRTPLFEGIRNAKSDSRAGRG
jgi:glycogen debranching enzyme